MVPFSKFISAYQKQLIMLLIVTHEGWKLVDVCKGGDERYRNIIERELIEVKFECMGREDSFTTSL